MQLKILSPLLYASINNIQSAHSISTWIYQKNSIFAVDIIYKDSMIKIVYMDSNMSALNTLVLVLNIGTVRIELLPEVAPLHVAQIQKLVKDKAYDGIVFHRVISKFMAQTGDVKNGNYKQLNKHLAGTGGSVLPNIAAEFSALQHTKGTVSMARSNNPNSANSQFFICLDDASFLDGQYSIFGKVVEGMDVVDSIQKGHPQTGAVDNPDYIVSAHLE